MSHSPEVVELERTLLAKGVRLRSHLAQAVVAVVPVPLIWIFQPCLLASHVESNGRRGRHCDAVGKAIEARRDGLQLQVSDIVVLKPEVTLSRVFDVDDLAARIDGPHRCLGTALAGYRDRRLHAV